MEKILVIDDSKTQLFTISLLLKKESYDVTAIDRPLLARTTLEEKEFDLLLCDLQMPEINGIDFLRLAKTLYPRMPVVIMTAFGDRESAIEALSIGADDYIFKATGKREEEEFLIRIRRAIEKARLQRRIYDYQTELENMVDQRTRALTEAQEQLIQSEKLRSLGVMTNGIAHDFNNILGVIIGRTQLLMRKIQNSDTIAELKIIEKSALKGSSTIRRMQDYTRIRKDELFEPVQINEIIDEVIDITKTRWKDESHGKGITIKVTTDFGDIPLINGNASELKDVLINIIFNAIDSMPQGGTIAIRTYKDGLEKDHWITVDIADTGHGIAPEIQDKVFEPFFTTKNDQGSGLGMSVAYGIIQRHKGHISFTSAVNKGTVFTIRFPMALFLQSTNHLKTPEPDAEFEKKKCRVLIIDDDDGIRAMLQEILEIDDHEVMAAASGHEALKLLETHSYEVVFTDLGMPEMSGWELSQEIKKRSPGTRVIMITGWGTQLDQQRAVESGIEKIIPKPVSCDEILKIVREPHRM